MKAKKLLSIFLIGVSAVSLLQAAVQETAARRALLKIPLRQILRKTLLRKQTRAVLRKLQGKTLRKDRKQRTQVQQMEMCWWFTILLQEIQKAWQILCRYSPAEIFLN